MNIQFKSDKRILKACEKSDLRIDDVEDQGIVVGYASTFDLDPDSYGDVVAKGAFTKTLDRWNELNEQGKYIPLLYGHNAQDPEYNIGRVIEAKEDERGLLIVAEFDSDNQKAQYVRKLVKEGRVYQFSFAFDTIESGEIELPDGRKANELRELELYEVSLVQIPANQHATVEEIKSLKDGRRNSKKDIDTLGEIKNHADIINELVEKLLEIEEVEKPDEDEMAEAELIEEGKEIPADESAKKADQDQENENADFVNAYKKAIQEVYCN